MSNRTERQSVHSMRVHAYFLSFRARKWNEALRGRRHSQRTGCKRPISGVRCVVSECCVCVRKFGLERMWNRSERAHHEIPSSSLLTLRTNATAYIVTTPTVGRVHLSLNANFPPASKLQEPALFLCSVPPSRPIVLFRSSWIFTGIIIPRGSLEALLGGTPVSQNASTELSRTDI